MLASGGIHFPVGEGLGCYGLGSIANTFLPGRAGDALRIELFSRRLQEQGGRWLAGGVSVCVALAQSVVFGCVLGVGVLLDALPMWVIAPSVALPLATWGIGRLVLHGHSDEQVARLAIVAGLSPPAWSRLLGWVTAAALARLMLVVAVLDALAVRETPTVALVALCGVAIGNALPFAPGGAGVAAAAMSVALGHAGVPASSALAVAVSFHAFETAAALLFGASGWLLLRLSAREASELDALQPAENY